MPPTEVYLETGAKRAFASAAEWPGWCRSGSDEAAALDALIAYAPRYRSAIGRAGRGLAVPKTRTDLHIAEHLDGNSTTDFGAPGAIARAEARDIDPRGVARLAAVMTACWKRFDELADAADGRPLRKGPRGGGRDREKIRKHVAEAEGSYLSALGGKAPRGGADVDTQLAATHEAFLAALSSRAKGELPSRGPRGGERWPARYAARRAAWHVLDHAWELEDRTE
ncbi:MAG: hypothetical protein ABR525_04560 [Candidatus Limnocylindria bacterium]